MKPEILWENAELKRAITRTTLPSEETLKLLRSTIWGSREMKYRILDIDDKLSRLRDPSFFVLWEDGRELSVFVLDKCVKHVTGLECGAFHFAMASTVPDRQNEGLAGVLIAHVRRYCVASVGKPGLGFAYVEATTEFSMRLSDQIGRSVEADIPLTLFTRLFPKNHLNIESIKPSERGNVLRELEQMYVEHELTDFSTSLQPDTFFVFRENGAIVAGAQVEVLRWSMVSMPGSLGTFILNILPRLPAIKRMLDPKDLRIARLSNLFFRDGHENEFYALMEACLYLHGAKVGLIMLDGRSPMLHRLMGTAKMGLLSRAVHGSAKLCIDTVGMDDAMMSVLRERPLLVSAADVL